MQTHWHKLCFSSKSKSIISTQPDQTHQQLNLIFKLLKAIMIMHIWHIPFCMSLSQWKLCSQDNCLTSGKNALWNGILTAPCLTMAILFNYLLRTVKKGGKLTENSSSQMLENTVPYQGSNKPIGRASIKNPVLDSPQTSW